MTRPIQIRPASSSLVAAFVARQRAEDAAAARDADRARENGGAKLVHVSGGMVLLRAA